MKKTLNTIKTPLKLHEIPIKTGCYLHVQGFQGANARDFHMRHTIVVYDLGWSVEPVAHLVTGGYAMSENWDTTEVCV